MGWLPALGAALCLGRLARLVAVLVLEDWPRAAEPQAIGLTLAVALAVVPTQPEEPIEQAVGPVPPARIAALGCRQAADQRWRDFESRVWAID